MLKSQAHDVQAIEAPSNSEPNPEQIYAWYVEFVAASTEGMLAVLTSEERREHLRKVNVPLSFEVFKDRLTSMGSSQRSRFVSKMQAGYEGAKVVWIGRVERGMMERIFRRIGSDESSSPEKSAYFPPEPREETGVPNQD